MPAPDYLIEMELVAEDQAQFVSYEDNELTFKREVKRRWTKIRDDEAASCLDFLNTYSSAQNTGLVERYWVDDPQISRNTPTPQTFPHDALTPAGLPSGRWRVVSNEIDTSYNTAENPGYQGIVQTLRYGMLREVDWAEARVVSNTIFPSNNASDPVTDASQSDVTGIDNTQSDVLEDYLVVQFPNVDPAFARQMMIQLYADAADHPVVAGSSTSGNVGPAAGLSIVTIADDTWEVPGPRLNISGGPDGASEQFYSGFYHLVQATTKPQEPDDGSVMIEILLARPQYTLNAYRTLVSLFNGDTREEVVHYLWNVPKDLAQEIITAWRGNGRSASASYADDHLVNLTLSFYDYGNDYLSLARRTTLENCSVVEETIYYWGVENPTIAPFRLSDLTGEYNTVGHTVSQSVDLDPQPGRFNITIRIRETQARTTTYESYQSILEDRDDILEQGYTAAAATAIPAPVSAVQGEIITQTRSLNEDCTVDVRTTNITSREWSDTFDFPLNGGTALGWIYRNWNNFDDDASGIQTTVIDTLNPLWSNTVDVNVNQDGTYDVNIVSRPPRQSATSTPGNPGTNQDNFFYPSYHKFNIKYDDSEGQVTGYALEGRLHKVTYHASEAAAYEQYGQGIAISGTGVTPRNGEWRCDTVVALNQQIDNNDVVKVYDVIAGILTAEFRNENVGGGVGQVTLGDDFTNAPAGPNNQSVLDFPPETGTAPAPDGDIDPPIYNPTP